MMDKVKNFFTYEYPVSFVAKRWHIMVTATFGTILVLGLVI